MAIDQRFTGVCVVLLPDEAPQFEAIEDPHLTLHFLGRNDRYSVGELDTIAAQVKHYSTMYMPQHGTVNGTAQFFHPDGPVDVWLVDALRIGSFRNTVRDLVDGWRRTTEVHGFIPHITSNGAPLPEPFGVSFRRIALWAGTVRHEFPLQEPRR